MFRVALSSKIVPTAIPGVPVAPVVKPNCPMALPLGRPWPVLAVPAALFWFCTSVIWSPLGATRTRLRFCDALLIGQVDRDRQVGDCSWG